MRFFRQQLNSLFLLPLCLFVAWFVMSSSAIAHPTTHVDAWAKTGTNLDVRIVIVLHDVLAYTDVASHADDLIPADRITRAVEDFGSILLDRLHVYDDSGRRLTGIVQRPPRWKPEPAGVRLSTNSTLRLTWMLRYPWNSDRRALTIQHTFEPVAMADEATDALIDINAESTTADGSATCELRLHVLHQLTGRRIDSIVPPDRFHTIQLPDSSSLANSNLANSGRSAVPAGVSEARADLILTPGILIHEFTLPLTELEHIAWSGTRVIDESADSFPRIVAGETLEQIRQWARRELEIHINGTLVATEIDLIEFLNPQGERIDDSERIALVGMRVGIRTAHATQSAIDSFSARWMHGLGATESLTLSITTAAGSTSHLVTLGTDDSENRESVTAEYGWNRQSDGLPQQMADTNIPANDAIRHSVWTTRSPGISGTAMIVVVAVLAMLGGAACFAGPLKPSRSSSARRSFIAICCLGITAVGALAAWQRSALSTIPDQEGTRLELARMLSQVYRSTTLATDEAVVDELSQVLTDDLTEQIYSGISGSVLRPSQEGPLLQIDHVQLTECRPLDFRPHQWITADCVWQVSGRILHWGHIHDRQIRLHAILKLVTTAESTRIAEIHVNDIHTAQRELRGPRIDTCSVWVSPESGLQPVSVYPRVKQHGRLVGHANRRYEFRPQPPGSFHIGDDDRYRFQRHRCRYRKARNRMVQEQRPPSAKPHKSSSHRPQYRLR